MISSQILKIINFSLFILFFVLGAFTLFSHNAIIQNESFARRLIEERDERERITLAREAALVRFTLLELREHAREIGLVSIETPRFVKRGDEKPSLAAQ